MIKSGASRRNNQSSVLIVVLNLVTGDDYVSCSVTSYRVTHCSVDPCGLTNMNREVVV